MKNVFILLCFSLISIPLKAGTNLENNFKNLIKKHHFKSVTLGLYVEDEGKVLVDYNADQPMIPASLTKIATGAAILNQIPLNKKFATELWSKAPIEGESLKGALCLKGGGDPSFVSEKMWYLVNEFVRTNVKKIEGDILIDASRFDDEWFDVGRDATRVDRAFDAPVSASSFNWNSVNIFIRPGKKADEPANIYLDPLNTYFELENKTKTVSKSNVKSIEVNRIKSGDRDKITVTGSLSIDAPELVVYKSITNPNLWIGLHLKEFLNQRGIQVKGGIKISKCESESKILASSPSKNLNEMVADMLKFSNNFVAEMLVKNLAAEKQIQATSATMKDGIEALKNYLDSIGISREDYVLENVSGLTRNNRFTAKQLAKILKGVKNNFLIYPEFLSGLPIAGIDGTMKNRLKNESNNWVRAKTGYLDGVIGLAGYVGRENKSPLIFVFMFNGNFEQGLASRNLFDEFIVELLK